jgi:hypothetical protein
MMTAQVTAQRFQNTHHGTGTFGASSTSLLGGNNDRSYDPTEEASDDEVFVRRVRSRTEW